MKCLSVIYVIFCALAAPTLGDIEADISNASITCISQTGADMSKVMQLLRGEAIQVDDKIKCFGACLMKSLGMMSSSGEVNADAALAQVPQDIPRKDQIIAIINDCSGRRGSNDCETAWAIGQCLRNHVEASYAQG